jgi:hypothetical protein
MKNQQTNNKEQKTANKKSDPYYFLAALPSIVDCLLLTEKNVF